MATDEELEAKKSTTTKRPRDNKYQKRKNLKT